jgi:hypothetical protein
MRRTRLLDVGNDFLQALVVFAVASVVGLGIWYWLWPFGKRLGVAAIVGVGFGLFCGLGSLLRAHDIDWERKHTKALPLNKRRAARRRQSRRSGES